MSNKIFLTYLKTSNFEKFIFFENDNKIYYVSLTLKPSYSDNIVEGIIANLIERYPIEFDDRYIDVFFDTCDINSKMDLLVYLRKLKIVKLLNEKR